MYCHHSIGDGICTYQFKLENNITHYDNYNNNVRFTINLTKSFIKLEGKYANNIFVDPYYKKIQLSKLLKSEQIPE